MLVYGFLRKNDRRRRRVPILMYHDISDPGEASGNPYYHTSTTVEAFAAQMDYLHRAGYRVTGLDDLVGGRMPPEKKSVIITFDDGLRTFFTRAFPVLERYGFTATVFLVTGCVEEQGWFQQQRCLTWKEVRDLGKSGISFGSHTVSHPMLRVLDKKRLAHEVTQSRRMIEERTGRVVRYFSYPFAFPEEDKRFALSLKELLLEAGYRACVTTSVGRTEPGTGRFYLGRIPVNSMDDPVLFRAKLEGAYDWMHPLQLWSKKARFTAARVHNLLKRADSTEGQYGHLETR